MLGLSSVRPFCSLVLSLQRDNGPRFYVLPQACQSRTGRTDIKRMHQGARDIRFLFFVLAGESDPDDHLAAVPCALFNLGHVAEGPSDYATRAA